MGFYWLHWASPTQLLHTHPWGLWARHQSPTFFACIVSGLPRPILTLFFPHHTLPMGLLLTISLFPDSFEPICFLKAHLLISWTCDPLFLPLGLNGFFYSLSLANFSVLLSWASFLTFGFLKKKTLNKVNNFCHYLLHGELWIVEIKIHGPSIFLYHSQLPT